MNTNHCKFIDNVWDTCMQDELHENNIDFIVPLHLLDVLIKVFNLTYVIINLYRNML